jgi:hypothetical protein
MDPVAVGLSITTEGLSDVSMWTSGRQGMPSLFIRTSPMATAKAVRLFLKIPRSRHEYP